ncbi:MAG: hypothetical protein V3V78_05195 [Candidatus Woesearchaeota archaeon]
MGLADLLPWSKSKKKGVKHGKNATLLFFQGMKKVEIAIPIGTGTYTVGRATPEEKEKFFKKFDDPWVRLIGNKIAIKPMKSHDIISRKHVIIKWNPFTQSHDLEPKHRCEINNKRVVEPKFLKRKDKVKLAGMLEFQYI